MENQEHSNKKKIVIGVVLLALVVLGAYMISRPKGGMDYAFTRTNVSGATTQEGKLPPRFPTDLPMEENSPRESYIGNYPELKYTLSVYSYFTTKARATVYADYLSYIKANGYMFYEKGENAKETTLHGYRGNEDLQVIIQPWQGRLLVHINYKVKE